MNVCGIDPGFNGGMAILEDYRIKICIPMPIYSEQYRDKNRKGIIVTK